VIKENFCLLVQNQHGKVARIIGENLYRKKTVKILYVLIFTGDLLIFYLANKEEIGRGFEEARRPLLETVYRHCKYLRLLSVSLYIDRTESQRL